MTNPPTPVVKDLVLVGGGHAHIAVLKRFGMRPIPGVRVTLLTRDVDTPYSGMLPGWVAGHYSFDDVHIDLAKLSRYAGARFCHQAVGGLDLAARHVICGDRPPIPYDILSINIGSAPSFGDVPGAAEVVVPVKPIGAFVDRWAGVRERVSAASGPVRIGIVGAGAGGVELLLAVQFALSRMLADLGRLGDVPEFHLFGATETILPTHNRSMRQRLVRLLHERGVHMHLGQLVTAVDPGRITRSDGSTVAVDEILWVTHAGAPKWPGQAGLAVDKAGFIQVDDTLRSISHPEVFAAGDVATVVNHPREKAGVFAVRQGRPLANNLSRALCGQRLRSFHPQRQFLTLVSVGGRYAVGARGPWSVEGALVWRWKNWIDRRFMAKYENLPEMSAAVGPEVASGLATTEVLKEISTAAMRCGGCGSKVGATPLDRVLAQLQPIGRKDVLIGLDAPDDAAVIRVPPGQVLVRTVDAFRAFVDDPFVFGQITANHCLGDIFAMGADAQTALAVVTVPFGLDSKVEDTLVQLLSGTVCVLNAAGAALVGGHTTEGAELYCGLSLTGLVDAEKVLRKGGLQPGDRLVLTKGLGTGTLFAAEMRRRAKGRWIDAAISSMLQSSQVAAGLFQRHGATACTDVTGFGLLGHLVEMTKASGVSVRLDLSSVPILDGALETTGAGLVSSLQPHNLRLRRAVANVGALAGEPRYTLLYDPQTAGGLLAGVPADRVEACVKDLEAAGYKQVAVIGVVEKSEATETPIEFV